MLSFFGGRIRVSPFALVLALIIAFSPDAPFYIVALIVAAVHEAGHLFAMKRLGAKALCLSIYPFGADIRAKNGALSYRGELVCALSGPLASLLTALPLLAVTFVLPNAYTLSAAVSSLAFFAVNILPAKGLDGGRALLAGLLMHLELSAAYRVFGIVSTVFFAVLCTLAFALLAVSGYNLSLIFICTYLLFSEFVRSKACPM